MATVWTKITKASGSGASTTIQSGTPMGLLLAFTYGTNTSGAPSKNIWTKITKASGTLWTKKLKAT